MTSPEHLPWHAVDEAAVIVRLRADPQRGLTREQVDELHRQVGPNALPERKRRSIGAVFASQFRNPLIYLLFGAAAIALALREVKDAIVIFVVVMLNALVGAYQEGRAEHALAALRRMTLQRARVVRAGEEQSVAASELVPGDLIVLAAGDAIPADARLLDEAAVRVAEAALTGESVPVSKRPGVVDAPTALGDRTNMVYAGTHVTAGRARAVIVATGTATEIGHIASLAEGGPVLRTPLERRIDRFGRQIMVVAVVMFALFLAVGLFAGVPIAEIAMVGISQVVGLIPEGLPVAMTVALAVGVQRMARRRAIVRRLSAVETLGATTVICTDKTGTLTRNELTVVALWSPGSGELEVTGSGYGPAGGLRRAGVEVEAGPGVLALVEAATLCNDARITTATDGTVAWRAVGDPTEAALVTLALKLGLDPDAIRAAAPRRAEIPFDAALAMMATQHATPAGSRIVVKGAAEAILALCSRVGSGAGAVELDDAGRAGVRATVEAMAARALRVLAIAEVADAEIDGRTGVAALRGRATLLGLVGEIDPPRPEAAAAVATCLRAGIRPVMVTGDHALTGLAVARELGIARDGDLAIDGPELDALGGAELEARLDRIGVFARVQPAQKLRIVEAYQRRGEVVAMTGDGVNDAPALMRADVGVAMGLTGTDVAKEAAKIVITDDDFGSIVAAVEEGRVVYRNIKKAVLLLMSTAFGEVFVLLGAVMLGYPPPFAAVQILWNNLVTEGVITVNLILDPAEGDEMRRPPISTREPLITREMWRRMALMTPTIVAVTLGWFVVRSSTGVRFEIARTEAFTLLAVCEWFNVLNCLSARESALRLGVLRDRWLVGGLVIGNLLQLAVIYVPALNTMFHTVPIPLREAIGIGAAGSLVLWVEEVRKLIVRRRDRDAPADTLPAPVAKTQTG